MGPLRIEDTRFSYKKDIFANVLLKKNWKIEENLGAGRNPYPWLPTFPKTDIYD
jgi:hypothetical protein